jgi:hypothetical protein
MRIDRSGRPTRRSLGTNSSICRVGLCVVAGPGWWVSSHDMISSAPVVCCQVPSGPFACRLALGRGTGSSSRLQQRGRRHRNRHRHAATRRCDVRPDKATEPSANASSELVSGADRMLSVCVPATRLSRSSAQTRQRPRLASTRWWAARTSGCTQALTGSKYNSTAES